MAGKFNRIFGQDQAAQQRVPVTFRILSNTNLGDPDQPGQWTPLLSDEDGNLLVTIAGASGTPILLPDNVDNVAEVATDTRVPTLARLYALDGITGTNFDRLRTDDDSDEESDADGDAALRVMGRNRRYIGNFDQWFREHGNDVESPILASAARTVTTTSAVFTNPNFRAGHFILDITAGAGFDIEFALQGRIPTVGTFYPILESASIVATGTTVFKVGIGFTPVAMLTANDLIPVQYRVVITHNNASSVTYSVNANLSV